MSRLAIHAGPPLDQVLEGFDGNRSGRLNSVAERYIDVMADEVRRAGLSVAEWSAVFDTLNGAQIEAAGPDWQLAWASVMDNPELDEKWGVDHQALGLKLKALSVAGRAAVWDLAARFWAHAGDESGNEQVAAFLERTVPRQPA